MQTIFIRAVSLCAIAAAIWTTAEAAPAQTEIAGEIERLIGVDGPASIGKPCGGETSPNASLARFYGHQLLPFWVRDGKPSMQAVAIIGALKDAASKGLAEQDYDAALWDRRLDSLHSGAGRDIAGFDVAMTACILRYASDVNFGLMPAAKANDGRADLAGWLRDNLPGSSDPVALLASLEPPFSGYRRSLDALRRYRVLASQDDGEMLPAVSKSVKPGDAWSGVPRLARLLRLLGDLPADAKADAAFYREPLVSAVSRYQRRHGLDPDGHIGRDTVASLNTPLARRVRQLELTLERWREAPRSFSRPPIVINIPEFLLHALNDGFATELQMKVVTGKAYGHQTPVFTADMKYLIFRPYWDVPYSITRKELLPHLLKDPGYLAKNHYEVVDQAQQVVAGDPSGGYIYKSLSSGVYRIRQIPGKDNALGGVKFMFPNENDVYMHGTPAVELFSKTRRDFSHGCIRVEKPEELAAWVLRGKPEWTAERIHAAMNGDEPVRVNLDRPVPVLIVYGTAVVAEGGEAHFFDDIYGLDAQLERALTARANQIAGTARVN